MADQLARCCRVTGAIGLVLLATACAVPPRFELRPGPESREPKGPVLWIRGCIDARSTDVTGSRWRCLVPGMATGREHRPRPEVGAGFEFVPAQDLREAFAQLARESGRFSQVVLDLPDIDRPGRLWVLDATIHELSLDLRQYGYGLGPLATVFWCLSLPSGDLRTRVNISIRLTDSQSRPIYAADLSGTRHRLRGLYFNADWRRPWVEAIEEVLRREWRAFWSEVDPITEYDG